MRGWQLVTNHFKVALEWLLWQQHRLRQAAWLACNQEEQLLQQHDDRANANPDIISCTRTTPCIVRGSSMPGLPVNTVFPIRIGQWMVTVRTPRLCTSSWVVSGMAAPLATLNAWKPTAVWMIAAWMMCMRVSETKVTRLSPSGSVNGEP